MNEWDIQSIPPAERSSYAAFAAEEWQSFLFDDETELIGVSSSDAPCGAALARTSDDRYEIVSLIVAKEKRHQGIGTALLHACEQSAILKRYGTLDVCYSVSTDDSEKYLRFFIQQGYVLPREHACHYCLPIDRLAQSKLALLPPISKKAAANIFPVNHIDDADARVSYSFLTSKLPASMRADHAPGSLLDEYSICYVSRKNVLAYVIFSEYEGRLHLHCAHTDGPTSGKALIALLRKAYDQLVQEPERFSSFSITSINDTSKKLVHSLLSGADPVKRHIFYTQKILTYNTPLLPEWGGVLARSNALADMLASAGGIVSLCADPGMLPYLLWLPENDMQLELFYSVEDELYTKFTLSVQIGFDAPDDQLERFRQTMTDDPGPAMLIPGVNDRSYVLAAIQTEDSLVNTTHTLDGFLLPFIEQAKRLLSMLKET